MEELFVAGGVVTENDGARPDRTMALRWGAQGHLLIRGFFLRGLREDDGFTLLERT